MHLQCVHVLPAGLLELTCNAKRRVEKKGKGFPSCFAECFKFRLITDCCAGKLQEKDQMRHLFD